MPRNDRGDDYDRPPRKVKGGGLAVAQIIVWCIAAFLTILVGLVWLLMMTGSKSAIQESSGSAMAAAVLIGIYILARAADKILGTIRSMRE